MRLSQPLKNEIQERGESSAMTHQDRSLPDRQLIRRTISSQYGETPQMMKYIGKNLDIDTSDATTMIAESLKILNENGTVLSFTDYDPGHSLLQQKLKLIYDEILKEHQNHISLVFKLGNTKNLSFDEFINKMKEYISSMYNIDNQLSFGKFANAISNELGIRGQDSHIDIDYRFLGPKMDLIILAMNKIIDIERTKSRGGRTGTKKSRKSRKSKRKLRKSRKSKRKLRN
jgi:hypothetical protein